MDRLPFFVFRIRFLLTVAVSFGTIPVTGMPPAASA